MTAGQVHDAWPAVFPEDSGMSAATGHALRDDPSDVRTVKGVCQVNNLTKIRCRTLTHPVLLELDRLRERVRRRAVVNRAA